MSFSEIERLLGVSYPPEQVLDVLSRLGFAPELVSDDGVKLKVSIPTWRSDVSQAADIVEEVARIIGYDSLPERLPVGQTTPVARDPMFKLQRKVSKTLVGSGFWEAITYVTVSKDDLDRLGGGGGRTPGVHELALHSAVRLRNPLQADRDIMRPTLLPSLLNAVSENLKHQRSVRFFELARGYLPSEAELPHEANLLAAVLAGDRAAPDRYQAQPEELDFFDAKGAVDEVLDRIGVGPRAYESVELPYLHPGRAARIAVNGQTIGIVGELRPDRAASFGIEDVRVSVAELNLDTILPLAETVVTGVRAPRFLPVEQDFAVVVATDVAAGDVEQALRAGAGPLASGFTLFDLYQGPQLGEGKKSLAYRIVFTAPDRALTDAELGKVREKIARELKRRVGGELRG
jgi:phenylalanyl-tRNA synthetase beta chain